MNEIKTASGMSYEMHGVRFDGSLACIHGHFSHVWRDRSGTLQAWEHAGRYYASANGRRLPGTHHTPRAAMLAAVTAAIQTELRA